MLVKKKERDDTCPHAHTLFWYCMHRTRTWARECTCTCSDVHATTHTNTHTTAEAEKITCTSNMLMSLHTQASQLLLTTHRIIKETMTRQPSCWVFGGLLTISQLADQQTKAVIFRAGLLWIITKDSMMASDKTARKNEPRIFKQLL